MLETRRQRIRTLECVGWLLGVLGFCALFGAGASHQSGIPFWVAFLVCLGGSAAMCALILIVCGILTWVDHGSTEEDQ